MSQGSRVQALLDRAQRAEEHANEVTDARVRESLLKIADSYKQLAQQYRELEFERAGKPKP